MTLPPKEMENEKNDPKSIKRANPSTSIVENINDY